MNISWYAVFDRQSTGLILLMLQNQLPPGVETLPVGILPACTPDRWPRL